MKGGENMTDVVNLEKGGHAVNLSEDFPSLTKSMLIGLGWKPAETGADFDLDSTVLLLDQNKKPYTQGVPNGLIYFNHLKFGDNVIVHSADDLTGGSSDEGDDETITVRLDKLPEEVAHVVAFINIYDADNRGQKFGQVNDSYMRLVDADENEVIRHSLKKEYADFTGVVLADIYRFGSEWKVKAIAQGVNGDINTIAAKVPELV